MFAWIREALITRLDINIAPDRWNQLAPEAMLSRLASSGVDIDRELRHMLSGGAPNVLHVLAAEVLRRRGAVWTTNFDELIEEAAATRTIGFHRTLPDDNPRCDCDLGHLVKVHGTLSAEHVLARSEQVMVPFSAAWEAQLVDDCAEANVAIVGYAGSDVDLRPALHHALSSSTNATWFGTEADCAALQARFSRPIEQRTLDLAISDRPDLAAVEWADSHELTPDLTNDLRDQAAAPVRRLPIEVQYRPNALIRARVLDDFGQAIDARHSYRAAFRRGPRRIRAARALYSSGLIHGAPWRPAALAILNTACRLPVGWRWPHLQRLPYLTWNLPADQRLKILEESLSATHDDPIVILNAANAAKEVDPRRAITLGAQAKTIAIKNNDPADAAWASFILSLATRWTGDTARATPEAHELADGYGSLAGPVWIAWGHFELGAIAVLEGRIPQALEEVQLAIDIFTAAGSVFAFDGYCAMIATQRAAGNREQEQRAHEAARQLQIADPLRPRFKRDVLLVEEGEAARRDGEVETARAAYLELSTSPTLAQEILGLLGLGELQRAQHVTPDASWNALRRSDATGFGYGQVHAAITLGLAGELSPSDIEHRIFASTYQPPVRDDIDGLRRYCQGPDPDEHLLCFP
ncbi:MAG: SIR2 family protein [Solirubrobacteraceae bacterium]